MNKMSCLRSILTTIGLTLVGISAVQAQTAPESKPQASKSQASKPPASSSATPPSARDALLLDDLPPAPKRATPNAAVPTPSPKQPVPAASKTPEKTDRPGSVRPAEPPATSTDEGEDIGADPITVRLSNVARQMRDAEARLEQGDTSASTQQLQSTIIANLDDFLRQMQQRASGKRPERTPGSAADREGGGNLPPSGRPAQESSTRTQGTQGGTSESAGPQRLVKEVWGQLPEQLRQQMQSALPERFLPAYEQMIEDFYRRLAEEQSR